MTLRSDIETAINRNSAESGSDTPDYILARFLEASLAAFDLAVKDRDEWHGFNPWASLATTPPHSAPASTDAGEARDE